jgi:hypothetical protein
MTPLIEARGITRIIDGVTPTTLVAGIDFSSFTFCCRNFPPWRT